ncbi:hypothetical protein KV112_20600 [Mycolicibacter sp. MYC123]|uniref:Amidase domain-containing protein n=1 Tax=[Mycobacterium] zoologicum TaxID=2872311 RepID=A0ABU5YPW9_9MYCO|nr:hypothetical protein [Mycolicibacter sp. MYC123]MEB3052115.1 hypothetical protein [Mycolicibacter sp. MYC123]
MTTTPAGGPEMVDGPVLALPVTAGPITASSLGGVPFIGIRGSVDHFSGKRLAQYVRAALTELGLTIDPPA